MVWPTGDFSMPWGATDYQSLVAWVNSAQTVCGGPLTLFPPAWYAGKAVSPTDLPIAYYPKAMPHVYPFLVWATPQVLPFWIQALNSVVGNVDGFVG